jgi:hypothetical protein
LGISAKPISDPNGFQVLISVAATGGRTHHPGALNALNVGVEAAEVTAFAIHIAKMKLGAILQI